MRLLYIDESHSSQFYVLGSVLINDTGFETFQKDFNKFLLDSFKINNDVELKADDLWNGRRFWDGQSMQDRADAVKLISKFIAKTKLNLIVSSSNASKANDHEKYFILLPKLIEVAVKKTSSGSGSSKKHLMIIFDERSDLRSEKSIYLTIAKQKKESIKNFKGTCRIFDYGYEGISAFSRVLQVADFIAFFYKAYLEIQKTASLFNRETDKRKTELLEEIFKKILKNKITIKK